MIFRNLGTQPYLATWEAMKAFTQNRSKNTEDECWLLEHPPVYTQGIAGKKEHVLKQVSIPLVQSDRGGQVTYHGPGQIMAYLLVDLHRHGLGVKSLVGLIEQNLIQLLAAFEIPGSTQCGAPGVYVQEKKIASLGLRIKNGCSYHGLALNVDMDLSPFAHINPCGQARLQMTQMKDFVPNIKMLEVSSHLQMLFEEQFSKPMPLDKLACFLK